MKLIMFLLLFSLLGSRSAGLVITNHQLVNFCMVHCYVIAESLRPSEFMPYKQQQKPHLFMRLRENRNTCLNNVICEVNAEFYQDGMFIYDKYIIVKSYMK